jgi:hypothetical protein
VWRVIAMKLSMPMPNSHADAIVSRKLEDCECDVRPGARVDHWCRRGKHF